VIISYKKKFIFLHCRKTAGTYISFLLYDFLENSDLILGSLEDINKVKKLKISNHKELFKLNNFSHLINSIIKTTINGGDIGFFMNNFYKQKYRDISKNPPHMSIEQIHENFPETRNFFTFCFVRNPYDYAVSDYLWRIGQYKDYKEMQFKDYLKLKLKNSKHRIIPEPKTNWEIYTKKNKVSVDFVGKFENLNDDLEIIFSKIGLSNYKLKEKNLLFKKNFSRKNYREYYSKEEKDLVEKLHYNEIKEFEYEF